MPVSPLDIQKLKQPFGTLVADKDLSKQVVLELIQGAKLVVSVGDATTERLVSYGIIPGIAVIDGRERRAKTTRSKSYQATLLQCRNPAGGISEEAIRVLKDAIGATPPILVVVDGEEDLLALPLFALSPLSSVVFYGQPLEGLVAVKITSAKKREATDMMHRIIDGPHL